MLEPEPKLKHGRSLRRFRGSPLAERCFGEAVPADRVVKARDSVARSDALLIVGSSLMLWSGFRFALLAKSLGKPIAIVNRGTTRADDLAACKLTGDCGTVLSGVADFVARDLNENARGLGGRL